MKNPNTSSTNIKTLIHSSTRREELKPEFIVTKFRRNSVTKQCSFHLKDKLNYNSASMSISRNEHGSGMPNPSHETWDIYEWLLVCNPSRNFKHCNILTIILRISKYGQAQQSNTESSATNLSKGSFKDLIKTKCNSPDFLLLKLQDAKNLVQHEPIMPPPPTHKHTCSQEYPFKNKTSRLFFYLPSHTHTHTNKRLWP